MTGNVDRVSLTKTAKCKLEIIWLHTIHNFSNVNATRVFTKVVFPIGIDVLPTNGTNTFDLIGLLLVTLEFLTFQ